MVHTGNLNDDERLEIAEILAKAFKDPKKIALWMMSNNPNFGASPCVMIALGRGHKVLSFMRAAINQNQPFEEFIDG